jgi:phosphoserine phosphatase
VVATQVGIDDEGRYTGEITFYAYAENKATAIRELAASRGYDLSASFAYSDSVTDLAMLETVGNPFAVNPDKELRKAATERAWPILVFTKPVALRTSLPATKPTLAALAVGGVVVAGGVLWANARRRRIGA